jgi:hypothetical protein
MTTAGRPDPTHASASASSDLRFRLRATSEPVPGPAEEWPERSRLASLCVTETESRRLERLLEAATTEATATRASC